MASATGTISAENTFTTGTVFSGEFSLSISQGDWRGRLTLQRSFDSGSTWKNVRHFEGGGEFIGNEPDATSSVQYRIGFMTGNYVSGTATVRISN